MLDGPATRNPVHCDSILYICLGEREREREREREITYIRFHIYGYIETIGRGVPAIAVVAAALLGGIALRGGFLGG